MDYSVFKLLFLLGNEVLKNKIRNIEKINKRIIVHLEIGIDFIEMRIQEGLQSEIFLIYIYIYINTL